MLFAANVSQLKQLLKVGGGRREFHLSPLVTHIIVSSASAATDDWEDLEASIVTVSLTLNLVSASFRLGITCLGTSAGILLVTPASTLPLGNAMGRTGLYHYCAIHFYIALRSVWPKIGYLLFWLCLLACYHVASLCVLLHALLLLALRSLLGMYSLHRKSGFWPL